MGGDLLLERNRKQMARDVLDIEVEL